MIEWQRCQYDNIEHLEKPFSFKKYSRAVAFANAVAGLAEAHIHHPRLVVEWGKVTVAWGTHESEEGSGIKAIDQMLSEKTDQLYMLLNEKVIC